MSCFSSCIGHKFLSPSFLPMILWQDSKHELDISTSVGASAQPFCAVCSLLVCAKKTKHKHTRPSKFNVSDNVWYMCNKNGRTPPPPHHHHHAPNQTFFCLQQHSSDSLFITIQCLSEFWIQWIAAVQELHKSTLRSAQIRSFAQIRLMEILLKDNSSVGTLQGIKTLNLSRWWARS